MRSLSLFTLLPLYLLTTACSGDSSEYDATGVFEATEVTLSARAQGELIRFDCEEGDSVTTGDLLGIIDTTALYLQQQALLANLSANDARQLDVTVQLSSLRQQQQNLEQEKARFTRLLQKGAASQKQVDDIDHQLQVIHRQVNALSDQVGSQNRSLTSQSRAIEAQAQLLRKQISDCQVTTPITGVVLSKYAEQGEFAAPGRSLLKVGDLQRMRLRAYVEAPRLTTLRLGQQVTVYADLGADQQRAYPGTVTWISDQAEFTPKTIQTRDERSNLVYAIKVTVINDGLIKRGMYGNVSFGQ